MTRFAAPLPPDIAALLADPNAPADDGDLPPDIAAMLADPPFASGEGAARPALAAVVGVVAPPALLAAAAGGVGAWLRRKERAPVCVVAVAGPVGPARPAAPRTSAAARRLSERGFAAVASAGLCRVALPTEPLAFVAEAGRLIASAETGVLVCVGCSARDDELDVLLAGLDTLVLGLAAGAGEALSSLALASLERLGPSVTEVTVPTDPLGRRTAALGLRPLTPVATGQDR